MTAVLGFITDTEMLLMADSAYHAGCRRVLDALPKIFVHGAALIGVAGSVRHGQIVQYHGPAIESDGKEAEPLRTLMAWVDDLRRCFHRHGYLGRDKDHQTETLGEDEELLVAYAGTLWTIGTNFQVIRHGRGPSAIGCGTQAARAAMLALLAREPSDFDYGLKVEALMIRAMEATATVDVDVAAPFVLVRMAR